MNPVIILGAVALFGLLATTMGQAKADSPLEPPMIPDVPDIPDIPIWPDPEESDIPIVPGAPSLSAGHISIITS